MTWSRDTSARGTTTLVPSGKSRGPVLFIFPGIDDFPYSDGSKTGAAWMVKQVPEALADFGAVVVARKSSAPYAEVKADADASLAKLGYSARDLYALGFSGGATILLGPDLATAGWKRVMLVDPSIPPSVQQAMKTGAKVAGLDHRVEMRFNSRNWGGYPTIKAAMVPLGQAVMAVGGKAEETADYHTKFMADAFSSLLKNTRNISLFDRPVGAAVSLTWIVLPLALFGGYYLARRQGWVRPITSIPAIRRLTGK